MENEKKVFLDNEVLEKVTGGASGSKTPNAKIVKCDYATVRDAPSGGNSIGQIKCGTKVYTSGKFGNRYYVIGGCTEGYVFEDYIAML